MDALIQVGAQVVRVNDATHFGTELFDKNRKPMRSGVWDLEVKFRGKVWRIEVKVPGKKLNDNQKQFHPVWNEGLGEQDRIYAAWSAEDALRIVGAMD